MSFPHLVLARVYEHVEPIDRGDRYEDPLQATLEKIGIGRVTGGGSQLGVAIRCQSETSNIEFRSKLNQSGGRITGTWEERTYNAEGTASGQVTNGNINLAISGGVTGSMLVSFGASRQSVSISTQGIALKGVSIDLTRN